MSSPEPPRTPHPHARLYRVVAWLSVIGAAQELLLEIAPGPGALTSFLAELTMPLATALVAAAFALRHAQPLARGVAIALTTLGALTLVIATGVGTVDPELGETAARIADIAFIASWTALAPALASAMGRAGDARVVLVVVAAVLFIVVRLAPQGDPPAEAGLAIGVALFIGWLARSAADRARVDEAAPAEGVQALAPSFRRLRGAAVLHMIVTVVVGMAFTLTLLERLGTSAYVVTSNVCTLAAASGWLVVVGRRRGWALDAARVVFLAVLALELGEVAFQLAGTSGAHDVFGAWLGADGLYLQGLFYVLLWSALAERVRRPAPLWAAVALAAISSLPWMLMYALPHDSPAMLVGAVDSLLWLVALVLVLKALTPPARPPVDAFS